MYTQLLTSTSIGILGLFLIWIGETHMVFSTICMGILSLILLSLRRQKEDVALFVGFAILGVITEGFVVTSGAWYYTSPLILGLPGWLPFAWGMLAVFLHDTFHLFHKRYHHEKRGFRFWTELGMWIACIYVSMNYFHSPLFLIFFSLAILFVNMRLHYSKEEYFFVLYFAIGGCITEILGVSFNIWDYTMDTYVQQIVWMSLLYSQFALISRRIIFYVTNQTIEKRG